MISCGHYWKFKGQAPLLHWRYVHIHPHPAVVGITIASAVSTTMKLCLWTTLQNHYHLYSMLVYGSGLTLPVHASSWSSWSRMGIFNKPVCISHYNIPAGQYTLYYVLDADVHSDTTDIDIPFLSFHIVCLIKSIMKIALSSTTKHPKHNIMPITTPA